MKTNIKIIVMTTILVGMVNICMANQIYDNNKNIKIKSFDQQDMNHDGFISQEEYEIFNKKRFLEIDTNHDNKISRDEIKTYYNNKRKVAPHGCNNKTER